MDDYAVILFDGECNFCSFWVKYVVERDKKDLFRFASLQSEKGKELLNQFNLTSDLGSVVLIKNDSVNTKSTAALFILKEIGGFYKMGVLFFVVPKFIRDGIYDIIADNRKKFLKSESCIIPSEQIKKKFI